jgi:polysaccharide chain length determinant protein (PEP-CTERM system associated)
MLGNRQLGMQDYLRILRRKWWLIVVLAIAGTGLGFGVTYVLPKKFTSQTLVLIQQPTVPGDYVKPVISQDINQRLTTMQQQILSRSRLEPVIRQFGLYPKDIKDVPMEDLVGQLRKTISIVPIRANVPGQTAQLQGFSISVAFTDPHLAQQICSTITSMFMEENLKLRQELSEQTTQFLSKQLDGAKAVLDEQDAKLAAFKRNHIGTLPDEDHGNLGILGGLTTQLDAATQALARAEQDKTFAQSVLAQQTEAWRATSQTGQNPQSLQQQLSALELQLSSLESKYTQDHPDVVKAKNDVEALKKKIADAQDSDKPAEDEKPANANLEPPQMQNLRAQIYQYDQLIKEKTALQEELQRQIRIYQTRVESSPATEQEYKELTRDYDTALRFYNELLAKRDQSAMATDLERRQQGEQFQVLDPANLPDKPSFPNIPLFTAGGGLGGLSLGLGLILLFEILDGSLRTREDVEMIVHLPVLAVIPVIDAESTENPARFASLNSRKLENVG